MKPVHPCSSAVQNHQTGLMVGAGLCLGGLTSLFIVFKQWKQTAVVKLCLGWPE
uniref:Uncharacterized protein n=1 Tax=Cairina moschata TaxID=8855 RepID=A0A8C3C1H1_CAIMO